MSARVLQIGAITGALAAAVLSQGSSNLAGSPPLGADGGAAFAWRLPACAGIEGDILTVEVKPGDKGRDQEKNAHCETEVDLAPLMQCGSGVVVRVRLRASDISEPDRIWNGIKVMLRVTGEDGRTYWPGTQLPLGTFDWREAETHYSWLKGYPMPRDGRAALVLGLQGCTGRVQFDLSTLRVESEDLGVPMVNEDYIVKYPAPPAAGTEAGPPSDASEAARAPATVPVLSQGSSNLASSPRRGAEGGAASSMKPRRGFMLPGRNTTEQDIADMAAMGATMARFQITRNWHKVDDNRDLAEYFAWLDRRLDNLADVLGWAAKYGLKICIDLHQPPGGKHGERPGQPLEMAMFTEDEYAEAFIEAWRRIAARCAPIVRAMGPVIYGYDLINEPTQQRPVRNNYWDIQRRAAEAVREIDPNTPIVFAANLASRADAFRYLRPIAMDNVIYQAHCYLPRWFTHQGVGGNAGSTPEHPLTWPGTDPLTGERWDREWLRKALQPVRDFQLRHHARIYVGEFSAAAWAPGAENYLRDCIAIFEEYGWDWTYHAFRESAVWDVEKSGASFEEMEPDADTPRRRALLDGFAGRISPFCPASATRPCQ